MPYTEAQGLPAAGDHVILDRDIRFHPAEGPYCCLVIPKGTHGMFRELRAHDAVVDFSPLRLYMAHPHLDLTLYRRPRGPRE